jgi:hypothetical protein
MQHGEHLAEAIKSLPSVKRVEEVHALTELAVTRCGNKYGGGSPDRISTVTDAVASEVTACQNVVTPRRTEEMDGGGKKMVAREIKILAPTETWIAPPKPFAVTSEKDDAPVQKIL